MNPDNTPLSKVTEFLLEKRFCNFQTWATENLSDKLTDAVAHFLISLQSDNTRRAYSADLRDFFNFLREQGIAIESVTQITERMVLGWQKKLQDTHTKYAQSRKRTVQSSVARKLSSLSSLLEFCVKRKVLPNNPLALIQRPKVKREGKTNAFTPLEVKRMLQYCYQKSQETQTQTTRAQRSWSLRYACLYTLFSVGMRVDEMCELRIADFEVTKEFARLHMTAKGNESHAPIVHPETQRVIEEYLATHRHGASKDDYLFVRAQQTQKINKLTQGALYEMLNIVAREVGIEKRVSPHSCRATLATMLHNKGVPIGQIQDLLNHKQITTTAIYIKKAEAQNEAAATKIHIME